MGISGSLKDVSVAEVLQFIHIGRRTGTLELSRGAEQARIGFHNGKLVGAQAPRTPRLGDLLVSGGLINRKALDAAISAQSREQGKRSLGQILVSKGALSAVGLRNVITRQIKQAIGELLTWESGTFQFVGEDFRPIDDIALYPSDVLPDADLNTQMVLLEAARIFDQRNRKVTLGNEPSGEPKPSPQPRTPAPAMPSASDPASSIDLELATPELEASLDILDQQGPLSSATTLELQVVSPDASLAQKLREVLRNEFSRIETVPLERAGEALFGAPPPIVLVDLRGGATGVVAVTALRYARPRASLVAVVDPRANFGTVYAAGALAVVPPDIAAVTSCIENVIKSRRDLTHNRPSQEVTASVARLRQLFGDLRSGMMSTSMALTMMHSISESVERAILFLAKTNQLVVLGAFGRDRHGKHLAELTRGLRLDLGSDNVLAHAVTRSEVQSVSFETANLPERLGTLVGRPHNGQVVVFPVSGAQRVIALIYADNGEREELVQDIEIIEMAAGQVGLAFENELLRHQISKTRS
ncbi:MAG: DUF4388 domain-containing protein [Thermoanaerobaculales bacterium]